MKNDRTGHRLVARRLAVLIADAVDKSGKTAVLVTSPAHGEGRSLLVRMIEPELERIAPNRFRIVGVAELSEMDPWSRPDDRVLLVDGPPVLAEHGFTELRRGWISAFDGALVVVVGRETRRDELTEAVALLHAAKIPLIGLIWNERTCPPLRARLQRLAERLRKPGRGRRSKPAVAEVEADESTKPGEGT